jgi:acyl-coenzyme A thioesterase PaaI-like protein
MIRILDYISAYILDLKRRRIMNLVGAKDSRCYVCGPENEFGLKVPFEQEGPGRSCGFYTARPEHGGWNGILHGGVTFSLMDEALGWALFFEGKPAVTARVNARFHRPVPIATPLVIRAWIVQDRRRVVEARAEIRADGPVNDMYSEADATMYCIQEAADGGGKRVEDI